MAYMKCTHETATNCRGCYRIFSGLFVAATKDFVFCVADDNFLQIKCAHKLSHFNHQGESLGLLFRLEPTHDLICQLRPNSHEYNAPGLISKQLTAGAKIEPTVTTKELPYKIMQLRSLSDVLDQFQNTQGCDRIIFHTIVTVSNNRNTFTGAETDRPNKKFRTEQVRPPDSEPGTPRSDWSGRGQSESPPVAENYSYVEVTDGTVKQSIKFKDVNSQEFGQVPVGTKLLFANLGLFRSIKGFCITAHSGTGIRILNGDAPVPTNNSQVITLPNLSTAQYCGLTFTVHKVKFQSLAGLFHDLVDDTATIPVSNLPAHVTTSMSSFEGILLSVEGLVFDREANKIDCLKATFKVMTSLN